jgi:hypothetical protein
MVRQQYAKELFHHGHAQSAKEQGTFDLTD